MDQVFTGVKYKCNVNKSLRKRYANIKHASCLLNWTLKRMVGGYEVRQGASEGSYLQDPSRVSGRHLRTRAMAAAAGKKVEGY